jgi:hypothetical protein
MNCYNTYVTYFHSTLTMLYVTYFHSILTMLSIVFFFFFFEKHFLSLLVNQLFVSVYQHYSMFINEHQFPVYLTATTLFFFFG